MADRRNIFQIIVIVVAIALFILMPTLSIIQNSGIDVLIMQFLALPMLVLGLLFLIEWYYVKRPNPSLSWGQFLKTNYLRVFFLIFLIIGGTFTTYLGVTGNLFTFGEFKPAEPPSGFQTGYAIVNLYDGFNGTKYSSNTINITVLDWNTETFVEVVQNGQPFYVSNSSIGYVNLPGYNNISFSIWAREDNSNPYVNTYYMYELANDSDFQFRLIKINDTYGTFNSSDVPVGRQTLTFQADLLPPSRDTTLLGRDYFIPKHFRGSYGDANNVSFGGIFIGFNGSVTNITLDITDMPIWNIPGYTNATLFGVPPGTQILNTIILTFVIDVLSPLTNITIFHSQIDNYAEPIAVL